MAKLLVISNGWEVPLDYFLSKPRFRPFYQPFTDNQTTVCEDDGTPIPGAIEGPNGAVILPNDVP
jgi:hypothetical protein